jgi:hypothetical protein
MIVLLCLEDIQRWRCALSIALASVITAIATALLATGIFMLVLIAVCKCHPKFTPGGAETGTSAGGSMSRWKVWLKQENECTSSMVDGGKECGKATSDLPTYVEVVGGGNRFQLKGNEMYVSTTKFSSTVATAHI